MSPTWHGSEDLPADPPLTASGWLRLVLRGSALGLVTFGGLGLLLLLRLFERPLFGQSRPVTPFLTQGVCRTAFVILGIRRRTRGTPMPGPGALVSNHVSWLDIFTLNAARRIYFVSKDEVADWPGIGWLARATGTVFIRRDRREAMGQVGVFRTRLGHGHELLFFPEGTSSDGRRVLPFKTTLFAAVFDETLRNGFVVQPVTLRYTAPSGQDARFYGWWADMEFGPHLLKVLAARRQGTVELVFHPPVKVAEFPDRKALAAHCEAAVRNGLGGIGDRDEIA